MAMLIVMPRLSPTMEEGVLAKWTKKEGDKISPGDTIAEVETDKANMDFPLEDEGVLLKCLVPEGSTVKLGAPVGILGEKGEDISALLAQTSTNASVSPTPRVEGLPKAEPLSLAPETTTLVVRPVESSQSAVAEASSLATQRVFASPLAKRIAADLHVDLSQVSGSGPGGRVVKKDVESFVPSASKTKELPAGRVAPLSMMRKTIAKRLTESKQTVPHFYLTAEVRVDDLWNFREQLNAAHGENGSKISVNDLVVKATARALQVLPAVNVSYQNDSIVQHAQVDLGVAVSLPDGLLTPVIRNANAKSLGALSSEIRDLAERGKQKKLRPEEYQGGTFTISNLGMYGIRDFYAIINPPESGILAVGQVEKRPVVVEREGKDEVAVQRCMTLTLSCDHRIVDGVLGAQFLAEIKKGLERPFLLIA